MRIFGKDLRARIIVFMTGLALLSLVVSSTISYLLIDHVVRSNIDETMVESAEMTRNLVEVALERRVSRMKLLSSFPILRDPDASIESKKSTLELFISDWTIGEGLLIADTAGKVICGSGNLGAIGNISGTEWFSLAQTAHVTFTYISAESELLSLSFKHPVITASTPVRDSRGQIFAYVIAFTTVDDITKAIEGVRISDSGHAFLIASDSVFIAGYLGRARMSLSREEKSKLTELAQRISSGRPGKDTIRLKGKTYLVSHTPISKPSASISEADWGVGVAVPEGEAYAAPRKILSILIFLTLVILVVATITSIFLGRSITTPIKELALVAEALGSGDLTPEVKIRTHDQIGTLAASMLRMRDFLRVALSETSYACEEISALAEEQISATRDLLKETEEVVDSLLVLIRNIEEQEREISGLKERLSKIPPELLETSPYAEQRELLSKEEMLIDICSSKAAQIATASQEQRLASREIASAARKLSKMASDLKGMVKRFKL
ncbi:MAG: HAMP domain-containing protein [Actinomycetota bacterium]|nr:HAMP domain-containing protein [Actinomycetota bacterium]